MTTRALVFLTCSRLERRGFWWMALPDPQMLPASSNLASRAEGIHALFTDIQMPGPMDGLGLAHHVRGHWPWIALLVGSGKSRPRAADMPGGTRFLPKPYELHRVAENVWELIDAQQPRTADGHGLTRR